MTFVYRPDAYFNLGDAGEHEIVYRALINNSQGHDFQAQVDLVAAVVTVNFGNQAQQLDVLKHIQKYPSTLREIEDEIRNEWLKGQTFDFDEGA